MADGALGLLGAGVARPVDRDRARLALDALDALTADDPERFATTVEGSGLLPRAEALTAHAILRELLEDFLAGPTTLDAAALLALADRAAEEMPDLLRAGHRGVSPAAGPRPRADAGSARERPGPARGDRGLARAGARAVGEGPQPLAIRLTSSSGRLPTRMPRSLSSTGPRISIPSIRPGSPSNR